MRSPLPRRGVTLLELLVVLVIVSILSTVAVGTYGKHVQQARYARARQEIRTLEIAIARYEVDTGKRPPSGRGTTTSAVSTEFPAGYLAWTKRDLEGSGNLQFALRSSLNGRPLTPLSPRWIGPYIEWDDNRMGDLAGNTLREVDSITSSDPADIHFIDPWGSPYIYINSEDYAAAGAELPVTHPFRASEVWYNASTFQIISFGPDRLSFDIPQRGLGSDDVTNFRSPD